MSDDLIREWRKSGEPRFTDWLEDNFTYEYEQQSCEATGGSIDHIEDEEIKQESSATEADEFGSSGTGLNGSTSHGNQGEGNDQYRCSYGNTHGVCRAALSTKLGNKD